MPRYDTFVSYRRLAVAGSFAELVVRMVFPGRSFGRSSGIVLLFSTRMNTCYPLAAIPGPGAAPAAATARHQFWHLSSPLLLSGLAAAGPARAQQAFTSFRAASIEEGNLTDAQASDQVVHAERASLVE